ncbi:MAG: hypothetical protein ACK6DA_16085, partial [Candidatus Kapaibacterium sp.]
MDKDTLLLRQVHPSWMVGDTISQQVFSSQTFRPTPKDNGLLSVYNGEVFDAYAAFDHFTSQGHPSVGVVAVTPAECESIPVPVLDDNNPFHGHCSLDYRNLSGTGIKKAASTLKANAQERGWLYKQEN